MGFNRLCTLHPIESDGVHRSALHQLIAEDVTAESEFDYSLFRSQSENQIYALTFTGNNANSRPKSSILHWLGAVLETSCKRDSICSIITLWEVPGSTKLLLPSKTVKGS